MFPPWIYEGVYRPGFRLSGKPLMVTGKGKERKRSRRNFGEFLLTSPAGLHPLWRCSKGDGSMDVVAPGTGLIREWSSKVHEWRIALSPRPYATITSAMQTIGTFTVKTAPQKTASNLARSDAGEVSTAAK
jgi:hypothetical protein